MTQPNEPVMRVETEEPVVVPAAGGPPVVTERARPFDQDSAGSGTTQVAKDEAAGVAQDAKGAAADVAGTAKDEAAGVAQDAKGAAADVAGTAKDEAKQVVGEAKDQARHLWEQTRTEATDQAGTQQQRLASGLRSLGQELGEMAGRGEQRGLASDLAGQASTRARDVADWLEQREPGDVLEEVRDFARRRPGAFLAAAAAIGLLGGRVTRGVVAEHQDEAPAGGDRRVGAVDGRAASARGGTMRATEEARLEGAVGAPGFVDDDPYAAPSGPLVGGDRRLGDVEVGR